LDLIVLDVGLQLVLVESEEVRSDGRESGRGRSSMGSSAVKTLVSIIQGDIVRAKYLGHMQE
jgi:hypothetical protein